MATGTWHRSMATGTWHRSMATVPGYMATVPGYMAAVPGYLDTGSLVPVLTLALGTPSHLDTYTVTPTGTMVHTPGVAGRVPGEVPRRPTYQYRTQIALYDPI